MCSSSSAVKDANTVLKLQIFIILQMLNMHCYWIFIFMYVYYMYLAYDPMYGLFFVFYDREQIIKRVSHP